MTTSDEGRYLLALERAKVLSASLEGPSLMQRFASLPTSSRERIRSQFTRAQWARLARHWAVWARPKQDPPIGEEHRHLFWMSGRGWGKTRTAAERVKRRVYRGARKIALIGPSHEEIVKYMIGDDDAEDGLLSCFHPSHRPEFVGRPVNEVRFHTGAVAYPVSAETPEFRGGNIDTVWWDEIAKSRYLRQLWANMQLSTRKRGAIPLEIIITGTPLPLEFLKELIASEETITLIGASRENDGNVDPRWIKSIERQIGSTRLGRQELEAEILGDNPDALFRASKLEEDRCDVAPSDITKGAVSVDPAIATNDRNDPTGIVVGGANRDGHVYVQADLTGRHKPEVWGNLVVDALIQHQYDTVVGERNRGGDLVAANVRAAMRARRGELAASMIRFVEVNARRGKAIRAEPVSSMSELGRLHNVGKLVELENEITEWNPKVGGKSPNRLDALVQLAFHLADLGIDEKPDPRSLARGMARVNEAIRQPRASAETRERPPVQPTQARRPAGWGSTL